MTAGYNRNEGEAETITRQGHEVKLIQSRGEDIQSQHQKCLGIGSIYSYNLPLTQMIRLDFKDYVLTPSYTVILDHMVTHIHYVISKVGLNDVH